MWWPLWVPKSMQNKLNAILTHFSQISAVPVAGLHWRPRRSHCAGRWQDQPPASLLVSCAPTSDVASADAVDGPWEFHQLLVIYTHLCKSWSCWHHLPHIDQKPQGCWNVHVDCRKDQNMTIPYNSFKSQLTMGWNTIKGGWLMLVGNSSGSIFRGPAIGPERLHAAASPSSLPDRCNGSDRFKGNIWVFAWGGNPSKCSPNERLPHTGP